MKSTERVLRVLENGCEVLYKRHFVELIRAMEAVRCLPVTSVRQLNKMSYSHLALRYKNMISNSPVLMARYIW